MPTAIATPGIGQPAVVNLPADLTHGYRVRRCSWSYAATPLAGVPGRLSVTVDGASRVDHDLMDGGAQFLDMDVLAAIGAAVVVTLGALLNVQSKLTVTYDLTNE